MNTVRERLFEFCSKIPKEIFDSCDHSASLLVERVYAYLENFASDENSCNSYCNENSRKLNILTLCDAAIAIKSQLGTFAEYVTSDMTKLCHTAPNPFACMDGKIAKKPLLHGILQRIFVRLIEMLAPGNTCGFDIKEIPDSEKLEASITAKKMSRPPIKDDESPPSKVICSLCDMVINFFRQIVTKETHVGRDIRQEVYDTVSETCQKHLNEIATGCDTLATLTTDLLDNLIDRMQNGICNVSHRTIQDQPQQVHHCVNYH
uniref:Saposin B-type domain-containing protein n=1 Tax=Syphacia muris TaxID=451379 RepID=A0A0N5AS04_9BILA